MQYAENPFDRCSGSDEVARERKAHGIFAAVGKYGLSGLTTVIPSTHLAEVAAADRHEDQPVDGDWE
jgi:hypothetical protein